MSGGSYDYFYFRFENDFIPQFENNLNNDPVRKAFAKHLKLVAKALYEIEWADSGDTCPGECDEEAMMACINKQDVLKTLIEEAKQIKKDIERYTK